jgi:hypothetical protein
VVEKAVVKEALEKVELEAVFGGLEEVIAEEAVVLDQITLLVLRKIKIEMLIKGVKILLQNAFPVIVHMIENLVDMLKTFRISL